MEGGSTWGSGCREDRAPAGGGCGGRAPAPKNFDIVTENRPFRDLRVHDIGKSSQEECL